MAAAREALPSRHEARFYLDAESARRLDASAAPAHRVLLVGGYLGYSNFGDILQLKGVLAWHRQHTGFQPVVVCATDAITDAGFEDRVRQWFGVDTLLFWSEQPGDFSSVGLAEISSGIQIDHLHIYGGGFFNRYWGATMLRLLGDAAKQFGLPHVVVSGQQVDVAFVDELSKYLHEVQPVLVGCRDEGSVEMLCAREIAATYSFDDATEPLARLAETFNISGLTTKGLLLHMNVSDYTDRELDAPSGAEGHIRSRWRSVEAELVLLDLYVSGLADAERQVTLLQGYTDRRVNDVVDSLGVVQRLESAFPFDQYKVVHLDHIALRFEFGELGDQMNEVDSTSDGAIAVSSSYHVALLCGMMGVPCWLRVGNEYYNQKRL
ncbi:MAG: hypothetical protein ABIQ39_12075, partial [Ilumatobacteraceae bacterium]